MTTQTRDVILNVNEEGPKIFLLKVPDLLGSSVLRNNPMTSTEILQKYWKAQGGISEIFAPSCFEVKAWNELQGTRYAVLTYPWETNTWTNLLRALKTRSWNYTRLIWIDIFCLNQNDPNKMETIRRSNLIYAWARSYHVMGLAVLKRGWCLGELGFATASPILYTRDDGLTDKEPMFISDENLENESCLLKICLAVPRAVLLFFLRLACYFFYYLRVLLYIILFPFCLVFPRMRGYDHVLAKLNAYLYTRYNKLIARGLKNRLSVKFDESGFTVEDDRQIVRDLIVQDKGSVEKLEAFLSKLLWDVPNFTTLIPSLVDMKRHYAELAERQGKEFSDSVYVPCWCSMCYQDPEVFMKDMVEISKKCNRSSYYMHNSFWGSEA